MHALLYRLGRLTFRRHWVLAAIWLAVLVAVLVLRAVLGGQYVTDYTIPGSESSQAADVLTRDFPQQSGTAGQIVFHAHSGTVADQQSAVNTAVANVGKLPHVVRATSPFATANSPQVSRDGTIAYAPMAFDVVPASLDTGYLHQLDDAVAPARHAGLQVEYGGGAGQVGQQTNDARSELIGLTCALLLLLLMFGALAAAAIPLLSAVFSVGAGLSLVGLIAAVSTVPSAAPTVATLLGLGVAIDYGLFLVARHREQLDTGTDLATSAGRTVATSGSAIVVAGGTVVIAILGLFVSGVPFVSSLGVASAIVVAVTVLAALTLIPALLGIAGKRVRARRARGSTASVTEPDHESGVFGRWGRFVSSRPWPWAVLGVVVLLVLAIPLSALRLGQLDAGSNPTSDSSRRAYDLMSTGFGPGSNGPLAVVVQLHPGDQSKLSGLQSDLAKTADVASVSAPTTNSAGTTAVLTVIAKSAPQDAATTDLVDRIRTDVLPASKLSASLTGTTPGYVDFTERVSQRLPWLIGVVVLLAFVLLTIAFRSLAIAVKAAVLNILSVGASYGVIVAVFGWQWGSGLLGIDESLPVPAFVPMLMFAIVFGLSMDYEVFLLSRIREAYLATGDARRSVAAGIGGTARVISTAAAIMVVVFLSFVLDPDPTIKMLAVGMAAAVLVDATVVRMLLVPAVMALLGDRAWWLPRGLDRIVPHLDLEGTEAAGDTGAGRPPAVTPAGDRP
ncbi:MMPL family transporter [Actinocatenispora sera]|uniref:Membrane protein n=1 Tax=Actinocatenispora sera TaxID=390989 RepID=A0A810L7M6_9ACTN|nr:MMPL family transporter [Actinocatenispora sera]BCJ31570.1 membrane protein [Actinocatenispora sera]